MALAATFRFIAGDSLNPFAEFKDMGNRWKDPIFSGAMAVVLVFAFMYLVGLWPAIRSVGRLLFFVCRNSSVRRRCAGP